RAVAVRRPGAEGGGARKDDEVRVCESARLPLCGSAGRGRESGGMADRARSADLAAPGGMDAGHDEDRDRRESGWLPVSGRRDLWDVLRAHHTPRWKPDYARRTHRGGATGTQVADLAQLNRDRNRESAW